MAGNLTKFKVKDDAGGKKWFLNKKGQLQKEGSAIIYDSDSNTWTQLKAAVEGTGAYASDPPEEITISGTITVPAVI